LNVKSRIALWLLRRKVVAASGLKGKEKTMFASFLRNWQTSLIGLVMGAYQLHQGGMTWANAVTAGLMAAFGMAAKDSTVSGPPK